MVYGYGERVAHKRLREVDHNVKEIAPDITFDRRIFTGGGVFCGRAFWPAAAAPSRVRTTGEAGIAVCMGQRLLIYGGSSLSLAESLLDL